MSSNQYWKFQFGDKTILWLSYLHNKISNTGNITSLVEWRPWWLHGVSYPQQIGYCWYINQPVPGETDQSSGTIFGYLMTCRCSLTSDEVRSRYTCGDHAEADESTGLITVPLQAVATLHTDNPELWAQLAPSAKGCFTLYRRLFNGTVEAKWGLFLVVSLGNWVTWPNLWNVLYKA